MKKYLEDKLKIKVNSNISYEKYSLLWVFAANHSIISLSDLNEEEKYVLSETFILEVLDYLAFDKNKYLNKLHVVVPNTNKSFITDINFLNDKKQFIELTLIKNDFLGLEPMLYRDFNPSTRTLIIHNQAESKKNDDIEIYYFTADFGVFILNCEIIGYFLNNPLSYLALDLGRSVPKQIEDITNNDYLIFDDIIKTISDDNLIKHDDDIEILLQTEYLRLINQGKKIDNINIKNIYLSSLKELMKHYS